MAIWTAIVRAVVDHGSQHGQYLFWARFVILRLPAAAAGNMLVMCRWHAQQALHCHCSGVVHRVPHKRLDGFQIDGAGLMPIAEDELNDPAYFLGDFLLDRFSRFFSCAVSVSSIGRSLQIFSLTSSKSRLS